MKNKAKKKKVRILSEEQKLELQKKRKEMAFKKKIRTTFSDVGFTQSSGLNRIDHSKLVTGIKKKTNKVFGIDTGGFETDDQLLFRKRSDF